MTARLRRARIPGLEACRKMFVLFVLFVVQIFLMAMPERQAALKLR